MEIKTIADLKKHLKNFPAQAEIFILKDGQLVPVSHVIWHAGSTPQGKVELS